MPVDLDSAIDTVAREMTALEPSGALRAHVLERIEQGRRQRAPLVSRWLWAGSAAAVVLAIATAVWMTVPARTPDGARASVAGQRAAGSSPVAAGPNRPVVQPRVQPVGSPIETAARTDEAPKVVRTGLPSVARETRRTAETLVAREAQSVPPLAEIEPLKFSTVEPDPLQIAAVSVAPFPAMPSIDIPSLGPDSNDIQSADPKKEK